MKRRATPPTTWHPLRRSDSWPSVSGRTSTCTGVRSTTGPSRLRDLRGTSPGVTPGPTSWIGSATDADAWDTAAPLATLYYVVSAYDVHGNQGAPSNEAETVSVLAIEGDPAIPSALSVRPIHPNPFRRATTLRLGLRRASEVTVRIHDIHGRRLRSLSIHAVAGWQSVPLTSVDDTGAPLASGVYLYSVSANGSTLHGKMIVAR